MQLEGLELLQQLQRTLTKKEIEDDSSPCAIGNFSDGMKAAGSLMQPQ